MGFFYSTEVTTLLEDIEPHSSEYNGYDDFLAKCTKNYKTVGKYFIDVLFRVICKSSKTSCKHFSKYFYHNLIITLTTFAPRL